MFDALCKLGKVEDAVEMVEEMKSKCLGLDVNHYTTLINVYCL